MLNRGSYSRCVIAGVLLLLPTLLPGQLATSATKEMSPSIDQQFAEINSSLTARAERLLVNADAALPSVKAIEGENSTRTSMNVSSHQAFVRNRKLNSSSALSRLESLRPQIQPILQIHGLPPEIAAVVLVESGANPAALSSKGALGLWQLMPSTARRYGLTVDGFRDDRLDVQKSTQAAARYLGDLYLQFGSWPLALAAYNTGEQNLQRAINRGHNDEFGVLSSLNLLPMETRNYVPAVLSAMRSIGKLTELPQNAPVQRGITAFAFTTQ